MADVGAGDGEKVGEDVMADVGSGDGLDDEVASTLIERAEESLLEIALSELDENEEVAEEEIREARKLELSDGYSEAELESLVKNEIITIENLADLATDELTEILEIDDDKAAKFIMSARQEWFKD